MEAITDEYTRDYMRLLEGYTLVLGPPSFSGKWDEPGYPKDELAMLLTYWDRQEGRIQLQLDHSDKEVPVVVTLASYPTKHQLDSQ